MQLKKTITRLIRSIDNLAKSGGSEFSPLLAELAGMETRLYRPLRVAIVGVMKAGKSTLMNAILKDKILFTGTLETTYKTTWFKYGETPMLTVVFIDGTEITAPFKDLEKWTVRPKDAQKAEIDKVDHVIVYYPNEMLKKMELIDTPGLDSTHGVDSQNTMDFLGLQLAKEAHEATVKATSQAEAVIYAFSRGVQGKDAEVLEAFQGDTGNASAINAIGIFTKADMYWNCVEAANVSPLETVSEACDGYHKQLKEKLYKIFPVVAKSVETMSDLNEKEFDILYRLAQIDSVKLTRRLSDAYDFITSPEDSVMTVSPEDRAHVLELYGQYGIYTVTEAIRGGKTQEELADYMYDKSGVKIAANAILQHFGNRAFLIKTDYILRNLKASASRIKRRNSADNKIVRVCNRIMDDIDRLRDEEQAFHELKLLQAYYKGEFSLSKNNEKEFLEIMCENGSHPEARLGFEKTASIAEMRDRALERVTHWSGLMNDYNTPSKVNAAAEIIVRSCEYMHYHLDMLSGYN